MFLLTPSTLLLWLCVWHNSLCVWFVLNIPACTVATWLLYDGGGYHELWTLAHAPPLWFLLLFELRKCGITLVWRWRESVVKFSSNICSSLCVYVYYANVTPHLHSVAYVRASRASPYAQGYFITVSSVRVSTRHVYLTLLTVIVGTTRYKLVDSPCIRYICMQFCCSSGSWAKVKYFSRDI